MASTISGNVGAANSGAIVSAIPLSGVGGRPTGGPVTSDVATAAGAFSLGGLLAGTYRVKAVLNNGQNTKQAGSDVSNTLFQVVVTVDGSSAFNI